MLARSRVSLLIVLLVALSTAPAHDVITTKITFNREIARILYARCVSCHRTGGSAFSLLTYNEARPWSKAIQEEVLERRMPPWGAIKGFGDFKNDQALTPEQIEVIADWEEGGAPEGEDKDLPPVPKPQALQAKSRWAREIVVNGELKLSSAMRLAGLVPKKIPPGASVRMIALLPDGSIRPMVWLERFKPEFAHLFEFRTPLDLPSGTVIQGVPEGASVALLVAPNSKR